MAVQGGNKEYNTFVAGIVTEANELTAPENSTQDEQNMELYRNGSRQRRLGMDFEQNHVLVDSGYNAAEIADVSVDTYQWENVGNNASLHMFVIQIKNKLWFTDINAQPITGSLYNQGNALSISGATTGEITFSSVNGVLIGTNKNTDPFYITYDAAADTMTKNDISLKGRDVFGVVDTLDIDNRPVPLSERHSYNLRNQGWTGANIAAFQVSQSVYPSNADIQHLGKDSSDVFQAALLVKQYFGNSPTPKGSYIIDLFDRGASRNAIAPVTTLVADQELGRPTTSVAYGQRVFYSGITSNIVGADANSPSYNGMIFFTKVITSNNDLGVCHQEADPSSEHISDIIGSDGGFINIPEAKNILKLETTETSLVVIAENGIWEIYGDAGGFSATTYQVARITNIGCVGKNTVINAEDSILYWSRGGIYALSVDKISARLAPENISEKTVQTLFNTIDTTAKKYTKGLFDPGSRKIIWLYNDDDAFDEDSFNYKANKELVLDVALQAFYIRSIKSAVSSSPFVCGANITDGFISASTVEKVVVGGDDVIAAGETLISGRVSRSRGDTNVVYLTLIPSTTGDYSWTISSYYNANFVDWFSHDLVGVDANAYLHTGQELFGDTQRRKQVSYITTHFKRTETGFALTDGILDALGTSSCNVQARWDFSDHANSGKYGASFQAYRLLRPYQPVDENDAFNYGQSVVTTKNKLRGRGRALSLYISTDAGKDLYLLGWGLTNNMGTTV